MGDVKASKTNRVSTALSGVCIVLSAALGVAACTGPDPMTRSERELRIAQDMTALFGERETEVLADPLDLYDVMALALRDNMDRRLALMEEALALKQADVTSLDMLPTLAANAGYSTRSNASGSSSQSLNTGVLSLESSTSQDRDITTADLTMAWNVLDFGVTYLQARQDADRGLVMAERRRKVVHNLMQDVRVAYWRALAAQRLMPEMDRLVSETRDALSQARQAEERLLQPPVEILDYQMTLMDILQEIQDLRRDLDQAQRQLASLMGLKPGTRFRLRGPEPSLRAMPRFEGDMARLEHIALLNRPELREEDYQERISLLETRKALLRMLPGLELTGTGAYDSNSFLFNSEWAQAGVRLSWNMVNLLKGGPVLDLAALGEDVVRTRRMAVSMAVLTQVHLSVQSYASSRESLRLATEQTEVARRKAEQLINQARTNAASELERIRAEAQAAVLHMRRDMAYANAQEAVGSIYASLGMDPLPGEVLSHDIPTLSTAIRVVAEDWTIGKLAGNRFLPPNLTEAMLADGSGLTRMANTEAVAGPEAGYLPPETPHEKRVVNPELDGRAKGVRPIPDYRVKEGESFYLDLPKDTFAKANLGSDVRYQVRLGDGAQLPSWLLFDEQAMTLFGTPDHSAVGDVPVRVRAIGRLGAWAEDTFLLVVQPSYRVTTTMRGVTSLGEVAILEPCGTEEPCHGPRQYVEAEPILGQAQVWAVDGRSDTGAPVGRVLVGPVP